MTIGLAVRVLSQPEGYRRRVNKGGGGVAKGVSNGQRTPARFQKVQAVGCGAARKMLLGVSTKI